MRTLSLLILLLLATGAQAEKTYQLPNLSTLNSNSLFITTVDDAGGGSRHTSFGQISNQLQTVWKTDATNAAPISTFPNAFPGSTRMRNGSLWYWFASLNSPDCMKLFVSADGMSWSAATTNTCDYQEPDYHTNNAQGPYSREVTVQYDSAADKFYGVYNYDPYNTNANSQALGLIQSTDGTNWTRIGLIWPNGKTNGPGQTFAATWFTDDNGSNYLCYPHWHTGQGAANYFNFYVIRRLDNTYLNWSAPVLVITNGMTDFTWDMQITKNGASYEAYCYSAAGGTGVATNSTGPQNAFTYSHTLWPGVSGAGEGPMLFKFSPLYWRLYSRGGYSAKYIESLDGGTTWSKRETLIPYDGTFGGWHAPGILPPANPLLSLATVVPDTVTATKWGSYRSPSNTPAANMFLKSAGSIYTKWQSLSNETLNGKTVINTSRYGAGVEDDALAFYASASDGGVMFRAYQADKSKFEIARFDSFDTNTFLLWDYAGDKFVLADIWHYVGNGSGLTNLSDRILISGTPATAGAAGLPGQVKYDSSYLYICTATNTWRRIAHATW